MIGSSALLMKLACLGKMRQEKEEDTTEKRLLTGLFAKKAERSVNFWTPSEASQPIKLILHQNGGRAHDWHLLGW
jgi:hypothetical protein